MLTSTSAFFEKIEDRLTGPIADLALPNAMALLAAAEGWCIGWTAYLLATAWHETRLQPTGLSTDPAGLALVLSGGGITGKRLGQYILAGRGDPVAFRHCRKTVKGLDQAEEVAALAMLFQDALEAGGWH